MKSTLTLLIIVALVVTAVGCYTLNAVGTPAETTLSMSNNPTGSVIKHFISTKKVNHFVYGLVTPIDPDVAKVLSDEVKAAGGTHAINVKVHYQMTFVDGLVASITVGIYTPFTLTLEGDVVK